MPSNRSSSPMPPSPSLQVSTISRSVASPRCWFALETTRTSTECRATVPSRQRRLFAATSSKLKIVASAIGMAPTRLQSQAHISPGARDATALRRFGVEEDQMEKADTVIAVFTDHNAAESAVKKLAANGFEMKNLSVVGKGYHSEEKVVGFY